MDKTISRNSKLSSVLLILVSVLLLSFHFFLIYFINSTYIKAFVGSTWLGTIYAIGAIFNIYLFLKAPTILRRYGLIRMTLTLATLELIAMLVLAFPAHASWVIIAFIIHFIAGQLLMYSMDILLEHFSNPEQMGSMRGMFLTMWNLPPIITPFIAGLLIDNSITQSAALGSANTILGQIHDLGFWKIYVISAVFLLPIIFIIKIYFGSFRDSAYPQMHIGHTLKHFYKHKNIFDVFIDRIILNLFFAWTAVYLPIYLHEYIGFSWDIVGILIGASCLPYILFQRTIGKMQDRRPQEKTLLIAGFLITSIGTLMIPFITAPNIAAWAILLFVISIGASFIEVSTESYFFKHISPTNTGFIGLFRMTRSLPYIIMPPIIALSLWVMPFSYSFIILGLISLMGIRYAFLIRQ